MKRNLFFVVCGLRLSMAVSVAQADTGSSLGKSLLSMGKGVANELVQSGKVFAGCAAGGFAYNFVHNRAMIQIDPNSYSKKKNSKNMDRTCKIIDDFSNLSYDIRDFIAQSSKKHPNAGACFWTIQEAPKWLKFGGVMAAIARVGFWQKLEMKDLIKPIGVGLAGLLITNTAICYANANNIKIAGFTVQKLNQPAVNYKYINADTTINNVSVAFRLGLMSSILWQRRNLSLSQ